MRIGIDFDRTIFDTDGYKKFLERKIEGFSETYQEAVENGIYRPGKHAEFLGIELQQLLGELRKAEKFLYDDIEKLERYSKSSTKLILISRGDKEFQRIKIKSTGVSELFDQSIVISEPIKRKAKDETAEIDLMIDDRRDELEAISVKGILVDPERKEAEKVVEAIEKGRELET